MAWSVNRKEEPLKKIYRNLLRNAISTEKSHFLSYFWSIFYSILFVLLKGIYSQNLDNFQLYKINVDSLGVFLKLIF